MLVDESTIEYATKEELIEAKAELDMYSVLTDKEIYISNIINSRLNELNN